MGTLFPGISFDIKFDEGQDEHIEVSFVRSGSPSLPIDAAGTSILQASQILAYITLFRPSVLILDEPDSHLHPNNQRVLCNLITNLATKYNFTALISTHSRHVLDTLNDSANIVWVSKGAKVDFPSVSTAAMLMELGALDSVDYFSNGKLKCLFATEDSSDDSIKALSALLKSNGFNMSDTEIRSYSGCSKVEAAKVLRRFLLDKAPNVKFILHRDRDYMGDDAAEQFEKAIQAIDAYPFLTEYSDVENFFINAAHLSALNPTVTQLRAQALIDEATLYTKEKSIESLINIRTEAAYKAQKKGESLNPGKLAQAANADYEAESTKWRRGKIVLGRLTSLLHKELGKNPEIFLPSLRNKWGQTPFNS